MKITQMEVWPVTMKLAVPYTIVISAGGKESGEDGKKIECQIKGNAESHGIRIIGPNCLGAISTG